MLFLKTIVFYKQIVKIFQSNIGGVKDWSKRCQMSRQVRSTNDEKLGQQYQLKPQMKERFEMKDGLAQLATIRGFVNFVGISACNQKFKIVLISRWGCVCVKSLTLCNGWGVVVQRSSSPLIVPRVGGSNLGSSALLISKISKKSLKSLKFLKPSEEVV